MPSRDEIFEKVQAALVDALGVDDDEVTPEATMVGDLGAESIDFLDIVFRLEKSFSIKVPRSELFPEDVLSSTDFVVDGKLNDAGIAALKERMPFVDLTKFEANPSVQNFPNILTSRTWYATFRVNLTVNTSREIHSVLGRKSVRFMLNGVNLRDALVLD